MIELSETVPTVPKPFPEFSERFPSGQSKPFSVRSGFPAKLGTHRERFCDLGMLGRNPSHVSVPRTVCGSSFPTVPFRERERFSERFDILTTHRDDHGWLS